MFTFIKSSFLLLCLCLGACSSQKNNKIAALPEEQLLNPEITHQSVSKIIERWPESSKSAANSVLGKYGLPTEVSSDKMTWKETAPFKETTVYREEVTHNFPTPHSDVIEQVINYKVPASKVDDLVKFDGSLIVDRTKGELASRNDNEEMNILALNLADKLIREEISVAEARSEYARSAQAFTLGNTNQLTSALLFRPASETADADMAVQRRQSQEEQSEP